MRTGVSIVVKPESDDGLSPLTVAVAMFNEVADVCSQKICLEERLMLVKISVTEGSSA